MVYRFTKDCMIGIREIDEEHERLFQLLNETMELLQTAGASRVALKSLLKELKDYAGTHFAHEEAYMEKIGDRELSGQKREHTEFAEKIDGYDISELSEEECKEKTEELLAFMARWLYRHILGSDTMIGYFVDDAAGSEDAFAFTDKYRTGIESVDEEHRRLFEIIRETNDLIDAELLHDKYDEIVHILDELRDYTVKHFAHEEEYMERIHYEGLQNQKIAHEAFVERLNDINLETVDDNQKEYLDELILFLLEWLSNHILRMDKLIPAE